MSTITTAIGLVIFALVGLFDYWVWSNLLTNGIGQIGALVGFGILAFLSFPITIFGALLGLLALASD